MHPAIELILARMESNPEEFVTDYTSRWQSILNRISEYAPKDEWKEVLAKWNEIRMHNVHREIMQELCAPRSPDKTSTKTSRLITTSEMKDQALKLLKESGLAQ